MMAADTSDKTEFKIIVIPADAAGCRFYLERYKPFRLAALRQDADGTSHNHQAGRHITSYMFSHFTRETNICL
jgi:hypothetical protein